MKTMHVLFALLLIVVLCGCTENVRSRNFGGKMIVDLPKGKKLVNVTWKDTQFWYLTRDMHSDEQPETYQFSEKSTFGINGEVIVRESK